MAVSVSPTGFLGVEADEQINVAKQHGDNIENTHTQNTEHRTEQTGMSFGNNYN